jgi:hypothetical protein
MAEEAAVTSGKIFSLVLFSDELQFLNNGTVNKHNMQEATVLKTPSGHDRQHFRWC